MHALSSILALLASLKSSTKLILITLCASLSCIRGAQAQHLEVRNIANKATLNYPVVLLRGRLNVVDPPQPPTQSWLEESNRAHAHTITAANLSSARSSKTYVAAMYQHKFKVLVELLPGVNHIRLHTDSVKQEANATLDMTLIYQPVRADYNVRFIYATAEDGDTTYQSQIQGDAQNYREKIDTAAKLLQCFVAEEMNDQKFGRKTFHFAMDKEGKAVVRLLKMPYSQQYLAKKSGYALWSLVQREAYKQMRDGKAKDLVITAFTRYDSKIKKPVAYAALGGMDTAVVSNLGMFSWPSSVSEVPAAFTNASFVDESRVYNQTAYRDTLWALASTTMGAAMHELGHALGLNHPTNDLNIMFTGYSLFHRQFMVEDAPDARALLPAPFKHAQEPLLGVAECLILNKSAWVR